MHPWLAAGDRARRRRRFFTIEPELSGSPVAGSTSSRIVCVFDTWLGDDLIRAYPAVLVTTQLKTALLALRAPTGFRIARAGVKTSRFFRSHSPGRRLPPFWAIDVGGRAGRDDLGLTAAGVLVVSRRVLDVLVDFRIGRAVLTQYASARQPGPRPGGRGGRGRHSGARR